MSMGEGWRGMSGNMASDGEFDKVKGIRRRERGRRVKHDEGEVLLKYDRMKKRVVVVWSRV